MWLDTLVLIGNEWLEAEVCYGLSPATPYPPGHPEAHGDEVELLEVLIEGRNVIHDLDREQIDRLTDECLDAVMDARAFNEEYQAECLAEDRGWL